MKAWLVGEQLEQSGEHVNCGRREHVKGQFLCTPPAAFYAGLDRCSEPLPPSPTISTVECTLETAL